MKYCKRHHLVWHGGRQLTSIGCAHCPYVLESWPSQPPDEGLVSVSQANHKKLCDRIRSHR